MKDLVEQCEAFSTMSRFSPLLSETLSHFFNDFTNIMSIHAMRIRDIIEQGIRDEYDSD